MEYSPEYSLIIANKILNSLNKGLNIPLDDIVFMLNVLNPVILLTEQLDNKVINNYYSFFKNFFKNNRRLDYFLDIRKLINDINQKNITYYDDIQDIKDFFLLHNHLGETWTILKFIDNIEIISSILEHDKLAQEEMDNDDDDYTEPRKQPPKRRRSGKKKKN